ncbi:MAG TPA: DEAD/DEAH box helicase [Bryobacteraceae bacterium]|jgi:superfamily II DNA or RNA helicase|nr:DEAD/DEAH box helicase [Bryobacteraceae bacterium]
MLIEQQIAERRERAAAAIAKVLERPSGEPYGDYRVKSASGKTYRVAMRGPGLFENYCSCPDFAVNTLGTCKHIEALLLRLGKRYGRTLGSRKFARTRASISLQYGETIAVRLRLPADPSPALRKLADDYCDPAGLLRPEHYRGFHRVLDLFRQADLDAIIYSDVLEYLDRENEIAEGLELERELLAKLRRGRRPLDGILNTKLLPYQERGAIFAACRGRVVLADDMGLGKTVQALAATEILRRRRGIQRVLVVAPASVKYQWKTEIEKFSGLSAQVIEGLLPRRRAMYASPQFFNLSSYELILKDVRYMHELAPDLIILDEAQRIRNWTTATARTIKQLKSRYAFVLTGTPLENKLEELFSVVEFIDGRRLGPAFRFLHEHRTEDEHGKLIGYRGLDKIHDQLAPILLRRTRQEVLKDLPKRTDQILHVPLTPQQAEPYWEQNDILAALMRKWERQGWLSEIDQKRILCCLQNMRMLCNSTFLFDKQTNYSPKLAEFREIVRELAMEEGRKVVVFSEYERMTHLAGQELEKLGIGFVSLHGSVPSRNRGALMEKFRRDSGCRVFLSTDAGGVGLNLQAASAVVNFEPPWNPARLEQRIGRVHRLGQAHPVHVVHLLTKDSIEERVWETLKLKKSLFAGVFDSPTGEVSFAALGRKSILQAVKEIFADQPGRPKPLIDQAPAKAIPIQSVPATAAATAAPQSTGFEQAAAGLIETGVRFLESLAAVAQNAPADETFSNLVSLDPRTNRPVLSIPLPKSVDQNRLVRALSAVLGAFGRSA